ncbi:4'-phosphopantetheinyl transferase superfamily protein [Streptomyces sp. A7024]|uniref:4'-phosphopantetheinyl transferase superfamily protein n=1 Tax=Streptomyces coryli TaxID=1128680 RepID=A0A6G4U6I5_9ACTN|nr:4'-phosphopantetheinyl transferase superfamily protein [Streptomyces coryli]NGN67713.1 4'-phosphopantetheinyl transferase superfamily protein [Streptomyces coryli]
MTPTPTALAAPAASKDAETPHAATDQAECRIWALAPLSDPTAYFGLLDGRERGRCESFTREVDLSRYVTGRVLAKTALAHMCGARPEDIRLYAKCPGCGGPHGKPQVLGAAEGWELSITHSGDVVAVALAEGRPVGLDVEQYVPRAGAGIAEEFALVLTAAERASVERLPLQDRERACLTYWARKEAVLKATGEGLNTPMTDFTLSAPDAPAALLGWHPSYGDGRPVPAMADVALAEGYHSAVAVLNARTVLPSVEDSAQLMTGGRARGHPSWAGAGSRTDHPWGAAR